MEHLQLRNIKDYVLKNAFLRACRIGLGETNDTIVCPVGGRWSSLKLIFFSLISYIVIERAVFEISVLLRKYIYLYVRESSDDID